MDVPEDRSMRNILAGFMFVICCAQVGRAYRLTTHAKTR
jgi:hypothetical protein